MKRAILASILSIGWTPLMGQVPDLDLPESPAATSGIEANGGLLGRSAFDRPAEQAPKKLGTLTVQYVGNTSFTEAQLAKGIEQQYASVENFGLNAASAYDVSYFLEVYYRKQGYSQVQVTATITGPWSLRLDITEGPLTKLGSVSIGGGKSYSDEELMGYLLGPLKAWFPRIKDDNELPFVESLIEEGVGLVRRLYGAEGFLDAKIESPKVTFNSDFTRADVEVVIAEGIQYQFGEISFIGNTVFSDEELLEAIHGEVSEPFTIGRAATAVRHIADFYKERGYYQASVKVHADPPDPQTGRVETAFTITQGALYHFDGVSVTGSRDVPPDFVAKRMQSLSGKQYDPELVDKKFRELIQTGLFQTLRINPEPVEDDLLRLDVEFEEAKTKEFGIGIGYGTFVGGILTFTYSDLNLFHSGRPFTTKAEITQRGYNGEVVYTNPWLFDTDYEFKARLYAETITLEGYSKNELGFRPSLARDITAHWNVEAFILAKYVNTYDILIDPEYLAGDRDYTVASIGISQTIDYRNDPAIPTSGFFATAAVDFAPDGVGEVSFVRGVASAAYYVPVTKNSNLAFGVRGGIISPLSDSGLPIDERFFNGGASSVRSYPELKLGPKDDAGWPLGGQTFTVFNAEYIFPIWDQLKGAVFFDAGNVLPNAADFGLSDMRYGIGGGLRYNLPVGPIRFDYGFNPDPHTGDPQGAFHFSVGVAF